MKKFWLLSLCIIASLIIAAAAQTPSSNSQDQQATQAQMQDKDQQQPAATGKQPLKYERHEGFWGHLNPFARKKYVERQTAPIRGRVNELDELTAKNSRMIADVDARSTEGIRNAMGKANEADSHALEAGNRASQAQQTADQATSRLTNVEQTVSKLDQYQAVTQTEIRFRAGQAALSQNAKAALDEMAVTLKGQKGYVVEVQGFSQGRGAAAIENSRQLAQSVVRYLVLQHDIPVYRIYTVGMGNQPIQAENGKIEHTRGGRVEISLLKNSLGELNPSTASSSTPAQPGSTPQN
ncbi:MAG TPA: OmpA family protein [Verrucomicrobiae bacterium]|jgi:outer membrane protein OmpA-like peptidoglycan-associated protein|nr:OmpA family protein [Verrucomicrobiae bacterium]